MKSRTKKSMGKVFMVRLKDREFDLLHAAAERHEISMSDIAREALRTKVKTLLKTAERNSAGPRAATTEAA